MSRSAEIARTWWELLVERGVEDCREAIANQVLVADESQYGDLSIAFRRLCSGIMGERGRTREFVASLREQPLQQDGVAWLESKELAPLVAQRDELRARWTEIQRAMVDSERTTQTEIDRLRTQLTKLTKHRATLEAQLRDSKRGRDDQQ
ncbi:hypothetical protein G6O69_18470 [Pseudenhygromyxa sp. WMMC2535]|uniref:hypothetical protein n=1 Tax=Pseudenhygromyxa sp. WMMC2535 TaxID=2712867 RepID=UPI001557EC01|nr:hypothetical protein [Pseudenhygromyxa sp. WMMC2535]NVB39834.1 hypothetical protein [Pseudenhygromyxa sp. WMMC2535]